MLFFIPKWMLYVEEQRQTWVGLRLLLLGIEPRSPIYKNGVITIKL